jgi:type IV pilus assembly protein PilM
MSVLDPIVAKLKRFEPEALLDLRPAYPPVAVEFDRGQLTLVRVKPARKSLPILEAYRIQAIAEPHNGAVAFRPNFGPIDELAKAAKTLFDKSGTKPGRVSLVLPDNFAKVSIVTLPERPAQRKQLQELVRFKLRRSVPFRLEDAVISSFALPSLGPELHLLVAVMLRSVVEQLEAAFEAAGARPGLIDLCTPSLFNLVRPELAKALASGSDAAILNCTRTYFTLAIVRAGRVVFFRCKTYAGDEDADPSGRLSVMGRELTSSLSYYTEKLDGKGIGTIFVRAGSPGLHEVVPVLERLGIASVLPIDAGLSVEPSSASRLDPVEGQTLAPALGAASRTAS